LVPGDPRCIGRIGRRGRGLVGVGGDDSLGRHNIVTGEKILKLCCTYGRQNLGAPEQIVCLRQLLADQDGGDGGGR
jgi:hypothetical protein